MPPSGTSSLSLVFFATSELEPPEVLSSSKFNCGVPIYNSISKIKFLGKILNENDDNGYKFFELGQIRDLLLKIDMLVGHLSWEHKKKERKILNAN